MDSQGQQSIQPWIQGKKRAEGENKYRSLVRWKEDMSMKIKNGKRRKMGKNRAKLKTMNSTRL